MFQYLVLPHSAHFDRGFGATANAFRDAAELTLAEADHTPSGVALRIPVSFLFRHSIELYLKSIIVVLDWRFDNEARQAERLPTVLSGDKARPLTSVHDLSSLLNEANRRLSEHMSWLMNNTRPVDWELSPRLTSAITEVSRLDRSSTFFRYPSTWAEDQEKDSWKETASTSAAGPADGSAGTIKVFAFQPDVLLPTLGDLKEAANELNAFHAMLRAEVSSGE